MDSVANLTIEAGNFAPFSRNPQDSVKALAFTDFFRTMNYDAVGLSSSETMHGLTMWRDVAKAGLPVVVANVFEPPVKKSSFFSRIFGGASEQPLFQQCVVREDHGEKLGVIGFISNSAWKALPDSGKGLIYKSPFEMGKLIEQSARRCDHLTVVGEFQKPEADSLARVFPMIDVIVSSAIKNDHPATVGKTVIVGSTARGNNGNYVELRPTAKTDSTANFVSQVQTLDGTLPEDSTVARLLSTSKERINATPR